MNLEVLGSTRATGVVSGQLATGYWALLARAASGAGATLPNAINVLATPAGPSVPVQTPSNDAAAFTDIGLYSSRFSTGTVIDHITHVEWPTTLDRDAHGDTAILVARGGVPVASIMSHPHDGVGLITSPIDSQGDVRYVFSPPLRGNVLSCLTMGGLVFNGSAPFNDQNKPLVRLITSFEGGAADTAKLLVGTDIRNWSEGTLFCQNTQHYYTDPPPNALTIYSGPGVGGGANVFYDLQQLTYPGAMRSARVGSLELTALQVAHDCNYNGSSGVFGLALAPWFTIANRSGQSVPLLLQDDSGWGGAQCAGYNDNGTLLGSDSTIAAQGCFIACMAMIDRYFGGTATPADINYYLQNIPTGYLPNYAATVDSTGAIAVGGIIEFHVG